MAAGVADIEGAAIGFAMLGLGAASSQHVVINLGERKSFRLQKQVRVLSKGDARPCQFCPDCKGVFLEGG